jgi:drug/metabolite transporter (DMT)-like permease
LHERQLAHQLRVVRDMPKVERLKEEIGWPKVAFAIAVALDASLVAWLAQNYDTARPVILLAGLVAALALAVTVVYVSRLTYRRLKELEDA